MQKFAVNKRWNVCFIDVENRNEDYNKPVLSKCLSPTIHRAQFIHIWCRKTWLHHANNNNRMTQIYTLVFDFLNGTP